MQTYAQFKTKIKQRLFPSGEPLSLVGPHDAAFQTAMLDLQKWVPCLKQYNVSTFEFPRQWENAKTVVEAPFGQIRRVYTVAGGLDRWRDRVFYRSGTFQEIECWARRLYAAKTPVNSGLPALPYGFKQEEAAADSTVGRARVGLWAIYRHKLYIAPWLQSTELLIVEWDGEKGSWQDSDGVDETYWRSDAELAVEYYVAFRHNLHYGDPALAANFLSLYEKARADLMYWCRENTRQQQNLACNSDGGGDALLDFAPIGGGNGPGTDPTGDDNDPTTDTTDQDTILFAAVGDVGDSGADTAAVAAAIEAENPELFVALGDLAYNLNYPNDFGIHYQWAMDSNRLAPVPGNHDWDVDGTLDAYRAYFAAFLKNNGHNYEVAAGPIHFFIYDDDPRFVDGFDSNSVQAEWLRAKLLLSTARWKVVVMHRPPYSSDTVHGSDVDLQLQYAAWGAHLVIGAHAHDYERIIVGGLPYLVVGTGGHTFYPFGDPVGGSLVRITGTLGYLTGEANCDQMVLKFKDVAGNVLDTLIITAASTSGTGGSGSNVLTDGAGNVLTDSSGNVLTG